MTSSISDNIPQVTTAADPLYFRNVLALVLSARQCFPEGSITVYAFEFSDKQVARLQAANSRCSVIPVSIPFNVDRTNYLKNYRLRVAGELANSHSRILWVDADAMFANDFGPFVDDLLSQDLCVPCTEEGAFRDGLFCLNLQNQRLVEELSQRFEQAGDFSEVASLSLSSIYSSLKDSVSLMKLSPMFNDPLMGFESIIWHGKKDSTNFPLYEQAATSLISKDDLRLEQERRAKQPKHKPSRKKKPLGAIRLQASPQKKERKFSKGT